MSYALCGFILVFAVILLRKKTVARLPILAAGFILLFFSLSSLLQIAVGTVHLRGVSIPFSGFVGDLLGRGLLHAFSYFGSLLLSIVLFLISLFLIAQAPLFSIVGARFARWKKTEASAPPAPRIIDDAMREEEKKEEKQKGREKGAEGEETRPGVFRLR